MGADAFFESVIAGRAIVKTCGSRSFRRLRMRVTLQNP
jgi:hypothetical protein